MFSSIKIAQVFGSTYGVKHKFTLSSTTMEICSAALVLDPTQAKGISVFMNQYNVPIIGRWSLLLNDETDEVIVDSNILTAEDVSRGFTRKVMEFPIYKKITPNLTHTVITKLDDLLIDAFENTILEERPAIRFSITNLSAYLYLQAK
jgi:hypothetical protein